MYPFIPRESPGDRYSTLSPDYTNVIRFEIPISNSEIQIAHYIFYVRIIYDSFSRSVYICIRPSPSVKINRPDVHVPLAEASLSTREVSRFSLLNGKKRISREREKFFSSVTIRPCVTLALSSDKLLRFS